MKTAGVVFDFYDDPTGSLLKQTFPTKEELPEMVKTAHILTPKERDVLRDEAYALKLDNDGMVMRKFACVDAGNTLLSMLYLEQAAEVLPDEAVKLASVNLVEFARDFGMKPTPFVLYKAAASGMSRTRDSMRQPVVGDEADWAQRTNLVSVRGGADSGRVIPAANQMKTAGVEGGGATLTDDVKDNGPDKKNPAKPTPGPLKDPNSFAVGPGKGDLEVNYKHGVLDISGKGAKPMSKKSAAEHSAMGHYPLDSYGDVLAAIQYFDEHRTEMTPEQRHAFAVPVTNRIEELKIKTSSEMLSRYGSTEYSPDLEAHIASRKANAPKEFADSYNLLKEKRSSVTPDQFVELLTEVDTACGLNWYWGGAISDPYLATFGGKEKSASADPWSWKGANGESVNAEQLQALAQTDAISQNFSSDVAEAFGKDPVGIFESMPATTKTIMATLAMKEKTSGYGSMLAKKLGPTYDKMKKVAPVRSAAGIKGGLPSFAKVLGRE